MDVTVAITREDNGVTWLSGKTAIDFEYNDEVGGDPRPPSEILWEQFGVTQVYSDGTESKIFCLTTHSGHDVYFPADKAELISFLPYSEDNYRNSCG